MSREEQGYQQQEQRLASKEHHHSKPSSPSKHKTLGESSLSAPATPSCCKGRRLKVEQLEKQNMDLVQQLRKEQAKLEEQEKKFKVQLEEINSEHSKHLNKMGFLLANQKKVKLV